MEHEPKWHPQELPADVRFNNSFTHTHAQSLPHMCIYIHKYISLYRDTSENALHISYVSRGFFYGVWWGGGASAFVINPLKVKDKIHVACLLMHTHTPTPPLTHRSRVVRSKQCQQSSFN